MSTNYFYAHRTSSLLYTIKKHTHLKHVPIPVHEIICRKACCTVKCCPLVPAWATTIHKFQGFEAGFDKKDIFNHLICDPGDLKWEQKCPGALYTALSRAKTMGTFTDDKPTDSAIYWKGSAICETRITNGALKRGKRPTDQKVNCVLIDKRDNWVNYLTQQQQKTKKNKYTSSDFHKLKKKRFTQNQVLCGIANIITDPNKDWLFLKRNKYTLAKTFFGLAE